MMRAAKHPGVVTLLWVALLWSATLTLAGRAAAQSGPNSIEGFVINDIDGNDVFDPGVDPGIPGVTLTLQNAGNATVATTVSGPNGQFRFTNLATGSYTVTESAPAGFTPLDVTPGTAVAVVNLTTIRVSMDVGVTTYAGTVFLNQQAATPAAGTDVIKGFVINDLNGNGMQDPGEPWVNGVPVTLQDASGATLGTRLTTGFGQFAFSGLAGGTYTLVVQPPAGFISTAAIAGPGGQVVDPHTIRITTRPSEISYDEQVFLIRANEPLPAPVPAPAVVPPSPPVAGPAPSLTVAADKQVAAPGDLVTYTLAIGAGGAGISRAGLYDVVPAGSQFVDASDGGMLWGDTVAWGLGNLPPGTTGSVSFRVHVASSVIPGTALLDQAQLAVPGQAVASSSIGTPVVALPGIPLTLLAGVDRTTANPGDVLTYRLIYRNVGTATVGSLAVVDPLPAGLLFVDADANVQIDVVSRTLRFLRGDLAPGASGSISLRARVDPSLPAGTILTNQARIEAPGLAQPVAGNPVAAAVQLVSFAGTYKLIQNSANPGTLVTDPSSITVDTQNRFTVITVPADQPAPACLAAQGVLNPDGSFGVTTASGQVQFTGRIDPVSGAATLTVQRTGFNPFTVVLPRTAAFNTLPGTATGTFAGSATNAAGDGLRVRLTVDPGGNATFESDLIQLSPSGVRCRAGSYQVTPNGQIGYAGQVVGQLSLAASQPMLTYNYADPDGYQSIFQILLTRQ